MNFLTDIMDAVNGKKTSSAVVGGYAFSLLEHFHVQVPEWAWYVVGVLGAIGLAHKAAKTVVAANAADSKEVTP